MQQMAILAVVGKHGSPSLALILQVEKRLLVTRGISQHSQVQAYLCSFMVLPRHI